MANCKGRTLPLVYFCERDKLMTMFGSVLAPLPFREVQCVSVYTLAMIGRCCRGLTAIYKHDTSDLPTSDAQECC
jgi:hypothetical protein